MSKINHITIVLSFTKVDANGKQTEFKRRFANINLDASNDQIKTFSKLIERLTGETYSNIELIKSLSI
ncbi:TPA: sigS mRNA-stabilizing protein SroA [Staphylococcus aureus]